MPAEGAFISDRRLPRASGLSGDRSRAAQLVPSPARARFWSAGRSVHTHILLFATRLAHRRFEDWTFVSGRHRPLVSQVSPLGQRDSRRMGECRQRAIEPNRHRCHSSHRRTNPAAVRISGVAAIPRARRSQLRGQLQMLGTLVPRHRDFDRFGATPKDRKRLRSMVPLLA